MTTPHHRVRILRHGRVAFNGSAAAHAIWAAGHATLPGDVTERTERPLVFGPPGSPPAAVTVRPADLRQASLALTMAGVPCHPHICTMFGK